MTGTITLNPTGNFTYKTGFRNQDGSTPVAVTGLSDASDTTFLIDDAASPGVNSGLTFPLTDITTLPYGAHVKSVTPKIRASQGASAVNLTARAYRDPGADGSPAYSTPLATLSSLTGTIADHLLPAGGVIRYDVAKTGGTVPADDYLDSLQVEVRQAGGASQADSHRVYKVEVLVEYVNPPTPANLALLDVGDLTTTVRPRFVWDHVSTEGIPQNEFRFAVWALADINLFPGGRAAFEADKMTNALGSAAPSDGTWTDGPGFTLDGGVTWKRAKSWSVPAGGAPGKGHIQSATSAWQTQHDLPNTGAMVAYVQVAGQFEGSRIEGNVVAALDFTMNVTPPTAPVSVAAAWQCPTAAAPVNRNNQYRTKLEVSVPAQALGAFVGRRVHVEHSTDGIVWHLLPLGVQDTGTGASVHTFYDTLTVPGKTISYRSRVELRTASGLTLPSAYTAAAGTVEAHFDNFILRDPLDPEGAVVLSLQGDLVQTQGESMGEYRALGSALPAAVSDTMLGYRYPIQAMTKNAEASALLSAIRARRKTLIFQGDMEGWWRWVRFSSEATQTMIRQTNRRIPGKRAERHDFDLFQTFPAHGQPEVWE